jgi:hypothetical protein
MWIKSWMIVILNFHRFKTLVKENLTSNLLLVRKLRDFKHSELWIRKPDKKQALAHRELMKLQIQNLKFI